MNVLVERPSPAIKTGDLCPDDSENCRFHPLWRYARLAPPENPLRAHPAARERPDSGDSDSKRRTIWGIPADGDFELYLPSGNASQDIPTTFADSAGLYNVLSNAQLSNYGVLAVDNQSATSGGASTGIIAAVYKSGANGWVELPALQDSCSEHYPLSMNNVGEVLGEETDCSDQSDSGYWTWDPTNGVQPVTMPQTSAYTGSQLLGVNDNAQLLASLDANNGTVHWGTFDPVSGSSGAIRRTGAGATQRVHALR